MRIDSKKTAMQIVAALKASKKSQEEIGALLGIDQSRISRYRRADFVRFRGGVKKLCDYLSVKPHIAETGFDPSKHPELMKALGAVINEHPRNEKTVTALLKAANRLQQNSGTK
jgi:predicted XRE-type DNA-binding protein